MEVATAVLAIEFAGSLWVARGVVDALVALARGRSLEAARVALTDAAIAGLSLKAAASLLRTLEVRTWDQILAFAAILALRTALKHVLASDRARAVRADRGA